MKKFSLLDMFPDIDPIYILDVGAMGLGENTCPYADLLKANKAIVIGFEPDQDECDKLNRAHGPTHKFFPFFIGDGTEQVFHQTNYPMTGSLYKPNTKLLQKFQSLDEWVIPQGTCPVHTKRLDDIHEIEDVDFIKIDVQGSELNVFKGGSLALEKATIIQTEVEFLELYEKQPTFSDIDLYLRQHDYCFHTMADLVSRCFKPMMANNNLGTGIRQWIWGDAVYVKNFMHLDKLSPKKLRKMAVLLHDVFNSWDLCHLVLTEVDRQENSETAAPYLEQLFNSFS